MLSNKYPQVVFLEVDVHVCLVSVTQHAHHMGSILENFASGKQYGFLIVTDITVTAPTNIHFGLGLPSLCFSVKKGAMTLDYIISESCYNWRIVMP